MATAGVKRGPFFLLPEWEKENESGFAPCPPIR